MNDSIIEGNKWVEPLQLEGTIAARELVPSPGRPIPPPPDSSCNSPNDDDIESGMVFHLFGMRMNVASIVSLGLLLVLVVSVMCENGIGPLSMHLGTVPHRLMRCAAVPCRGVTINFAMGRIEASNDSTSHHHPPAAPPATGDSAATAAACGESAQKFQWDRTVGDCVTSSPAYSTLRGQSSGQDCLQRCEEDSHCVAVDLSDPFASVCHLFESGGAASVVANSRQGSLCYRLSPNGGLPRNCAGGGRTIVQLRSFSNATVGG